MLSSYAKKFEHDGFIETLKKVNDSYRHIPLMQFIKKEDQYPYRVLVGTILSARTKDELTAKVSEKLFLKAPNPLKLSQLSEEEIILSEKSKKYKDHCFSPSRKISRDDTSQDRKSSSISRCW